MRLTDLGETLLAEAMPTVPFTAPGQAPPAPGQAPPAPGQAAPPVDPGQAAKQKADTQKALRDQIRQSELHLQDLRKQLAASV